MDSNFEIVKKTECPVCNSTNLHSLNWTRKTNFCGSARRLLKKFKALRLGK